MSQGIVDPPEEYSLHVEWGTAVVDVAYSQITDTLKEYLKGYRSPHGGVAMGITPLLLITPEEQKRTIPAYKFNLLEDINQDMKNELFSCIDLNPDASFDDFARKFHGLTKAEILERINRK